MDGKLLHFVRHGHATHNEHMEQALRRGVQFGEDMLTEMSIESLRDARLTEKGSAQAAALRARLKLGNRLPVQLIAVSPLSRTLQTAIVVPHDPNETPSSHRATLMQVQDDAPLVAVEQLRERSGRMPCEARRSCSELCKDFPSVNFSELAEEDPLWTPEYEKRHALIARATDALAWLMRRKEREIMVVTHASVMQHGIFSIKNKRMRADPELQDGFENCEMRSCYLTQEGTVFVAKVVASDTKLHPSL